MRKTFLIAILLCGGIASDALAVKVGDITRVGGQRRNFLVGLGLVVGLNGTGDGGDYAATINPLREMLAKFSDPVTVRDLGSANNVAIVSVMATIPQNGVREGDELDVRVVSNGAASSLKGGRLFVCPLRGPTPDSPLLALAEGAIVLEDPSTPTSGMVKKGAVMEADVPYRFIENGKFWLVLEDPSASWTNANMIAKVINEAEGNDGTLLATAVDPKNVLVEIPKIEQERPDSFMSRVQRLDVYMMPSEARVQINEKTGTLIVTGDVEISPVVIIHKGLTISTIEPTPQPTPRNPAISTKETVALDTTNAGGGKLQDLVGALEQLKVPAEDRITIV